MTTTSARISPSITPCSATVRVAPLAPSVASTLPWMRPSTYRPPLNSTSPRITTWLPIRASTTSWPSRLDLLLPNICLLPFAGRRTGLFPVEYLGGTPRTTPQCHPHALRGEVSRQHHAAGELLEVPERVILSRHLAALVQIGRASCRERG